VFTRLRQSLNRDDGAALVEFALVIPLLLVLILGIVDFGRAFNYWSTQTHLASQGARLAAVNTSQEKTDDQPLRQYLRGQAPPELQNGSDNVSQALRICISFPDGTTAGDPVELTTESTFSWSGALRALLPDAVLPDATITGKATMRIETSPTNYDAGCTE
jgi:Flp pilus assembly protein TadG